MTKNKQKGLAPLDTGGTATRDPAEGQGSEAVGLGDMGDHINQLKQVSASTRSLMNLLGDQLQQLSATIPVLRGFEITQELRNVLNARHKGLERAFDPLRAYVEEQKRLFCEKNAEAIRGLIQKRVEEGVKKRLPAVLGERLGKYKKYIKTNDADVAAIKQAMSVISARTANAILHPNYPSERVTLIPPHPEWAGLTLDNLKNIGGPAAVKLAKAQHLSPIDDSDSELARVQNLNMILKHLGVQFLAISSRNGLLLVSVPGKTSR